MIDTLRVIGALFLLFFLPGFTFVQVLFLRKGALDPDFDWLYRLALAMGLSIVITIIVCFGLNSFGVSEDSGLGYVTGRNVALSLLAVSAVLFLIGWLRGAYPFMGKFHPALIRFPPRDSRDADVPRITDKHLRFRYQELLKEKFGQIKKIDKTEAMINAHSGKQKEYYQELRKRQLAKLSDIESQISDIEMGCVTDA